MTISENRLSSPTAETIGKFVAIVGDKNALREPDEQAPYLTEWRDRYEGKTPLVLRPATVAEVSAILKLANETKTAIVPQGGNTGLVGGQIPNKEGTEIVLSLTRMNRIRSVDPQEFSITVDAGVTLAEIRKAADDVDRLFPLSLASEGSCQVGGNLATNAGGVHVLAYGSARQLSLGLEVVLANGDVWSGLRKLKKDNTGFDLKHLFIGSEGTLGIITGAVLQLYPKPAHSLTAFAGLPDLDAALDFFEHARSKLGPALTAFELLPRIGLDFVIRNMEGARDPLEAHYPWYVLIEHSGPEKEEDAIGIIESLLEISIGENIIKDAVIAQSQSQSLALWNLRDRMSEAQKPEGGSIKHDVSVPIALIPEFIARAAPVVESIIPGARPVPFGHFGDGNIHYNVSQPRDMSKDEFLANWEKLNEAIYALVTSLNGSISAEHGIGQMKQDLMARTKSPEELTLMRAIKASLDPNGILNPGKLL